jgi:hypothetical protein
LFFFLKMTFLFKIPIQGISLGHLHVHMYYIQIGSSPPFFYFLP